MNFPTEVPREHEWVSNSSLAELAELLRAEDGVMRPSQVQADWVRFGLVEGDKFVYCSKKGYAALSERFVYAFDLIPTDPRDTGKKGRN